MTRNRNKNTNLDEICVKYVLTLATKSISYMAAILDLKKYVLLSVAFAI